MGRGKFKEMYIKRGSTGEVYGIEVSMEEYLTYTTERKEKDARDIYVHTHGDFVEGLKSFVLDLRASGLSLPNFVRKVLTKELDMKTLKTIKKAI